MTQFISALQDPGEILAAYYMIAGAEWNQVNLDPGWIKRHRFIVLPVESADHFDRVLADQIASAMRADGAAVCLAVPAGGPHPEMPCYSVPATQEALLEFSRSTNNPSFGYFLTGAGESFLVLTTRNDYFLVAGNRRFVEKAIGMSIEEGRREFRKFVRGWRRGWNSTLLKGVARRYEVTPELEDKHWDLWPTCW